jgi:hypothetical protein
MQQLGTTTKSDTALTSFNVTVAGSSPVNNIAPFIISTYYDNGGNNVLAGDVYAYKNGAMEQVILKPSNSSRYLYGNRFANINNLPIYIAPLFDQDNNSKVVSYKYSNNGYSWNNRSLFNCGNEVNDIWSDQGFTPNAMLGVCLGDDGLGLTKIYSTSDGIAWTLVWQESSSNMFPDGGMGLLKTSDNNYFSDYIHGDGAFMYKLNKASSVWESYPMNGLPDDSIANCGSVVTDGQRFVLMCNWRDLSYDKLYYSNDNGRNWNLAQVIPVSSSNFNGIEYLPNVHKYSVSGGEYVSTDGISWQKTTVNISNVGVLGFNSQVGYVASNDNFNTVYLGVENSASNFNFSQVLNVSSLSPNLLMLGLSVGY